MRILKKIFIWFFCLIVLSVVGFGSWASDKYVVPIMMYHSINYLETPQANVVSPESFLKQMTYLKNNGYKVISLDALVNGIKKGKAFDRKSVVITFDDGYRDNHTHAFNILKKNGFPAIIFVPPDDVGKDEFLTWRQIKEINSDGISIGSHTLSQTYLPDANKYEQRRQIKQSKKILEAHLKTKINYLCYPTGGFSDDIKKMLKDAGYKGATTTNRGFAKLNQDVYELKRIRFNDHDIADFKLLVKLSGYYNIFRKQKNPF